MSFLKFWKGKPSKGNKTGVNADYVGSSGSGSAQAGAMDDQGDYEEGEVDKKGKLRHSLSISRSGRYKSKKKERMGFLDKPEMFNGPENGSGRSPKSSKKSNASRGSTNESPSSSLRGSQSAATGHKRNSSNPSSCREVNQQISSLRLKHPQGITSQPTAV